MTDTLTVAEDATAAAVAVLANDTDVEGDTRTVAGTTDGVKGVVVITGSGTGLTYKPNLNANGSDTFVHHQRWQRRAATGTVDVTINPVNDPRSRSTTRLHGRQGSGATPRGPINDSDPDSDALLITSRRTAPTARCRHRRRQRLDL